MAKGINMGRTCPWTENEVVSLYNKINDYAKSLAIRVMKTEGQSSAIETLASYNMFKYPVVYIFMHYHYGTFEDLGMNNGDITSYIMHLPMVKEFTKGILEGIQEQEVFYYDTSRKMTPALIDVCKEVLYIEENY
ncbi:MAG: hypothetical protein E7070_05650 [Bacteroidales bacterium]|nr:hypothetical protein [Bacteroidales bacterium]